MKKVSILLCAVILGLGIQEASAFHYKKKRRKKGGAPEFQNAVKINPIDFAFGRYHGIYERALTDKTSIQLLAGYIRQTGDQTIFDNSYENVNSGFILIPEYRYYFGEALSKFYVAPYARVRMVSDKLTDTSDPIDIDVSRTEKVNNFGGGAIFGGQFLLANGITLDMFLGGHYKVRNSTITYETEGVTDEDFSDKFLDFKIRDKSGLGLRLGFTLGYAF